MNLPPLNSLYAFNLAAEHMNFSIAAKIQGVSPGAISRQIRILEDFMGCSLFTRTARGVVLTTEGTEVYAITRESFEPLHDLKFIAKRAIGSTITIHCSLLVMRHWLMPRMQHLIDQLPNVELAYSLARPNLEVVNSDSCFIRIGDGRWPGLRSDPIMPANLVMVAAPKFARKIKTVSSVQDLKDYPIIRSQHSGHLPEPWTWWATHVWKTELPELRMINIGAEAMSYQAAIDGLGITIGREALLHNELKAGSLVKLTETIPQHGWGYYLVYGDRMNNSPAFRKLRRILIESYNNPKGYEANIS